MSEDILISIVLPAYNEAGALTAVLEQCDHLANHFQGNLEVVVVDDGSTDGTDTLVKRLSESRPWLRLVSHMTNEGYGRSLRDGFRAASGAYVFYSDSDGQFDLTELAEHWPLMSEIDMLVGYRVYRYDPLPRLVASWVYNWMVRLLFRVKVRDVDCSFKVIRASRLDSIVLTSDDFFIDTELVARARKWNWRVAEVGVRHYPRTAGRTTVRPSDVIRTLRVILKMWVQIHFPNRAQHLQLLRQQEEARRSFRGH